MSEKIKAPRGTFDALPDSQPQRRRIEDTARAVLERAGYERIETPIFEETELFSRGVGESTEVVQKQMFSFTDQGDRSLTLRPVRHRGRPLDDDAGRVLGHLHRLWGFTVRLETVDADGEPCAEALLAS